MRRDRFAIRQGIVVFWAMWFAIVFSTNLCDGLKGLGILPPVWAFASGNYPFMKIVTGRYQIPDNVTALLFLGVVAWEGLATVLFWRAVFLNRRQLNFVGTPIYSAFACGLALWSAFVLADELFIAYDLEASHLRLFIAQLVSLLFLELSPNDHEG